MERMRCVCCDFDERQNRSWVFVQNSPTKGKFVSFSPPGVESAKNALQTDTFEICGKDIQTRSMVGFSLSGNPAICVGDSDGWVRVFSLIVPSAQNKARECLQVVLLLCQRMHTSSVRAIKLALLSHNHDTSVGRLLILFDNNHLLSLPWLDLLHILTARANAHTSNHQQQQQSLLPTSPNPNFPNPIPSNHMLWSHAAQRFKLTSQSLINDLCFASGSATNVLERDLLFDHPAHQQHSRGGGDGDEESAAASQGLLCVGEHPILAFFSLSAANAPTTRDIAASVAHSLKSYAASWLPFGGGAAASVPTRKDSHDSQHSQPQQQQQQHSNTSSSRKQSSSHNNSPRSSPPNTPKPTSNDVGFHFVRSMRRTLQPHTIVCDSRRTLVRVESDVVASLALVTDKFGRVLLIDTAQSIVLRQWKGYRDAECCFCHPLKDRSSGAGSSACMVVFLPRRGVVEIWRLGLGTRIAVTTSKALLGLPSDTPHDLGSRVRLLAIRTDQAVHQCLLVDTKEHTFAAINVDSYLSDQ